MGKSGFSAEISRRDVLSIGQVIVNKCGITSIHWPKVLTDAIFLSKRRVNNHDTGHFRDRADWPFSYTILIMSVDSIIANMFFILINVLNKNSCFEDIVISKTSINHNTIIQAHFLYFCFDRMVSELRNPSWCSAWIYPLMFSTKMHPPKHCS